MPTSSQTLELESFKLKRNSPTSNIEFFYKPKDSEYGKSFYLNVFEIIDILHNIDFSPYYDDLCYLIQFRASHIHIMDISDNTLKRYEINFRLVDLKPFLDTFIKDKSNELDLTEQYFESIKKAVPLVNEEISQEAQEIVNLEGITPYIDRVRNLAKQRSNGQDDPVKLSFMKDGSKNLYFAIMRNNSSLLMNGGIIYDERTCDWSIHT